MGAGVKAIRRSSNTIIETYVARVAEIIIHREEGDRGIGISEGIAVGHIAIIVAFEGDDVLVAPTGASAAPGELMMQPGDVGHAVIAEFPESVGVGRIRKVIGGRRLIVIIRIDFRNAFVHEIISVLQLAMSGTAAGGIMTLSEHHALSRAKGSEVTAIHA